MDRLLNLVTPVISPLGSYVLSSTRCLGEWCVFVWEVMRWTVRTPFRWTQMFEQMEFVGVKSTGIIALTGFFSGAVFALQVGKVYALFNMESMVGATVGLSLAREIAPVFTALMVTARACSSMAAEIGTMKVSEQIDALETMAVNPIQYLAVPRIWSAVIMVPMLTVLYNFIGILGSYLVGVYILRISKGLLLSKLYYYLDGDDLFSGLIKAAVFGFCIAAISCYQGFKTRGGAQGVGSRTTRAVVLSSVTVLVVDYFLTSWIVEYLLK